MEAEITLNKMIFSLKEEFNQYSDDTFLSSEYLAFQIVALRADFISRHYANGKETIPNEFYSRVCMDLVEHEDQCLEYIYMLVSNKGIPSSIDFTSKSSLKNINFGSMRIKYINYLNNERLPYFTAGKFSASQLYYSIDDRNRIVLFNTSKRLLNDTLSFDILASNTEEAYEMRCKDCDEDQGCVDYYDTKFPINGTAYNVIMQTLRNQLIMKFRIPEDKINDTDNEIGTPNFANDNYKRRVRKDVDNDQE